METVHAAGASSQRLGELAELDIQPVQKKTNGTALPAGVSDHGRRLVSSNLVKSLGHKW